ncbi:LppP/LprE family lipoprotein [Streptomyces sp. UNOC14_S4]|nr:LppP/LprE family lipoprotein [Streptomyces sp. UNOC14_S4]
MITGGTVAALAAAAGLLLAGCESGSEGVRKEGTARTQSAAKPSHVPSASVSPTQGRVDAIKLIKADPKVSDQVKKNLKACDKNQYPVDVISGQLTGGDANDVVVNILTCGDSLGVASYVYRAKGDTYENVFASEQAPVYAEIDRRDLRVTKQVYGPGDAACCASGEDVMTYHWSGDEFRETSRTHTDFSKVGGSNDKGELPSVGTEG